ncbi:MAG: zinc-ribbon domain-containing protein [Methanomassiliicoccales archaeon]
MAFCSRCGSQAKEGAQFCDRCGAPLSVGFQSYSQGNQTTMSYTYRKDEKEAILAVILSVLIPGVGQIYCGKIGRGIGILVLIGLLSVIGIVPLFFITDPMNFNFAGFFALNVVLSILAFIIYIWQIYDAYRCADDYNKMAQPMRY